MVVYFLVSGYRTFGSQALEILMLSIRGRGSPNGTDAVEHGPFFEPVYLALACYFTSTRLTYSCMGKDRPFQPRFQEEPPHLLSLLSHSQEFQNPQHPSAPRQASAFRTRSIGQDKLPPPGREEEPFPALKSMLGWFRIMRRFPPGKLILNPAGYIFSWTEVLQVTLLLFSIRMVT